MTLAAANQELEQHKAQICILGPLPAPQGTYYSGFEKHSSLLRVCASLARCALWGLASFSQHYVLKPKHIVEGMH